MSCEVATLPFLADINYGTWSIDVVLKISVIAVVSTKMCMKLHLLCIFVFFGANIAH